MKKNKIDGRANLLAALGGDPRLHPDSTPELELVAYMAWMDYVAGNVPGAPPLPDDIPERPDLVYGDQWRGWAHGLGWIGNPDSNPAELAKKAKATVWGAPPPTKQ